MSGAARTTMVLSLIGAATLVGLIVWSSLGQGLGEGLRDVVASRWGVTTLVDLYLGLICVGAVIGWLERSTLRTALWLLGLALLGNLALLLYIAIRCARRKTISAAMSPDTGTARAREGARE